MYITTAFGFFLAGRHLRAASSARELAVPGVQLVDAETYNQLFTIHGTTMIFLFVMPMMTGLAELHRAAPDRRRGHGLPAHQCAVLLDGAAGRHPALLAATPWAVPPTPAGPATRRCRQQGGAGIDLWIASLVLLGISSVLGAINFLATIFKMRAPGLTLMRMPMFVWNTLVTSVLLLFAMPVLTAGLMMLFIDRNYGGGFFDPALGGNPVLWQHVFWFFGHPEVYILILPAFGIVTEILPVFSRKPLFGYKAFVFATASIGALGFSVWAHHMFTTGAVYLPFFSFFTFLIAVPTGIKFFNWLATMWGGQLRFDTPMLFALGFIAPVPDRRPRRCVPGRGAVRLPRPGHLLGRVAPALRAGRGLGLRHLRRPLLLVPQDDRPDAQRAPGQGQFVLLFIGTNLAFFPQHLLGLDGMIRRIVDYAPNPGWTELNFLSTIGAFMIARQRAAVPVERLHHAASDRATRADDPWDGNTLEWATTSPPPPYNFDSLPPVRSERPLFDLKHSARGPARRGPARQRRRDVRRDRADARRSESASLSKATNRGPAAGVAALDAAAPDERPETPTRGPTRRRKSDEVTADSAVLLAPHSRRKTPTARPASAQVGVNTALLGMLLFIGSEIMFFAGLFGAYFNARAAAPAALAAGRPRARHQRRSHRARSVADRHPRDPPARSRCSGPCGASARATGAA